MTSAFLRLSGEDDRADRLREIARADSAPEERFDVDPSEFRTVPRSPFAYWATRDLLHKFDNLPAMEGSRRMVRIGMSTSDDFRFLRAAWETPLLDGWRPYAKGGSFGAFYADLALEVQWRAHGREIKAWVVANPSDPKTTHWSRRIANSELFGRPGITWPLRTQRGLSFRVVGSGANFAHKGPCVFVMGDTQRRLLALMGLSNSSAFRALVGLQMAFGSYEVGVIQRTPIPVTSGGSEQLASLARQGWSLRRSVDTVVGVSHAFVVPAVLQVEGEGFDERVSAWAERVAQVEGELDRVEAEIDEICFELYGISEEDRRAISEGFGTTDDDSGSSDESDDGDGDDSGVELDPVGLAAGLVSWCVGVATGRFDVRLTTGERDWPEEPDPFDPLPVCSPAMLTGDDGLPMVELPAGYPLEPSPVLVNDRGHRLDVTARVRDVFDVVFGDDADAWWTEVGEVLDRRGELGSWLSKGFFDHHLKTHSKSRRKAPILWPIGTTSGSYQVWLYAHRVTADSLFRVLNDLVVPKLNTEESRLTRLRQEAGPNPSAKERKTIDTQEKLVSELVELREVIEELAPLWAPDLNDGIVIVLAPFWRLFAHHKTWMRELKKHWAKLSKGEYDWAQLAMHLWPERVIPKCAQDRSLAIAHDLETVFWQPDPNNEDKWIKRDTPTTPIDQLTADRHNPTTKTALSATSS